MYDNQEVFMILVYRENKYDPSMITKNRTSFFAITLRFHFLSIMWYPGIISDPEKSLYCSCNAKLGYKLKIISPSISLKDFNCSQTKFVAIVLFLFVFLMQFYAWPFFRLTHLTFRLRKRDKQIAPSGEGSFSKYRSPRLKCKSANTFLWISYFETIKPKGY